MKDWIEAQIALVESKQAEMGQVFMPYATQPNDVRAVRGEQPEAAGEWKVMAEILLHKQEIADEVLERVAGEGVIAIQTDDPDGFKFLSLEPASIRTDDFLWAALDALHTANDCTGAKRLVKNLAALASRAQEEKLQCASEPTLGDPLGTKEGCG